MLLAPRYNGIDLQVYDAGTPVVTSGDLRQIGEPDSPLRHHDRALRLIEANLDLDATQLPPPDKLTDILEKTDDELAEVAKMCGATLIGHEWALLHDPAGNYSDYQPRRPLDKLVPQDHIIVAEVDLVRDALTLYSKYAREKFPDIYRMITDGIQEYESKESGWILTDMWLPQFVVSETTPGPQEVIALVDIEPKIEFVD